MKKTDILAEVASEIKTARAAAGLTQSDAARLVDVPLSSYQGYEQGKNKPPYERAAKIIDVLSNANNQNTKPKTPATKSSNEVQPNPIGNAGIIFIDADTGKEFFVVEFPPYLRVINPYEVVLRPRQGPKPDVNDLETQKES